MIDKWLTINEIAGLLSRSKGWIIQMAKKDDWPYRSYDVRGGKGRRYPLAKLPEKIQLAYAISIKTSLADLQSQLKPESKPDKKIDIPRFSGRGAKTAVEIKTIENTPEKYLQIAAARRKVIEAYSASGLTPEQFLTAYNNGVIAADIRSQLGSFGEIKGQSSLYRWLERYAQYGLVGLAPQYSKDRGGSGVCRKTLAFEPQFTTALNLKLYLSGPMRKYIITGFPVIFPLSFRLSYTLSLSALRPLRHLPKL